MKNFALRPRFLVLATAATAVLALSSCSKVSGVASRMKMPKVQAPNLKMPKFKKPNLAFLNPKNFSWADLKRGKRVPIVEVREDDLKTQQSGEKLYLAYNKKKAKYGYYSNAGKVFTPVDFDPSQLAGGEDGTIVSSGILPARGSYSSKKRSKPPLIPAELPSIDLPDIPDDFKMPEDLGVPGAPTPLDLPPLPPAPTENSPSSTPPPLLKAPSPFETPSPLLKSS